MSVEMKGLDNLIKKVKKMQQNIQDEVDLELTAAVLDTEAIAKELSPADNAGGGGLRGKFFVDTTMQLSKRVGNSSEYAAYQEFGTGTHAASYVTTLPKDWQAYAMSFFVNGKGRVPAHPFLYPAFEQVRPVLIKRVTDLVKNGLK